MVHKHQSLMLSVLLFPPAIIFYPYLILIPVGFMAVSFGFDIGLKYAISVLIVLGASTFLKKRIARPRPHMREEMTFKPMILRKR